MVYQHHQSLCHQLKVVLVVLAPLQAEKAKDMACLHGASVCITPEQRPSKELRNCHFLFFLFSLFPFFYFIFFCCCCFYCCFCLKFLLSCSLIVNTENIEVIKLAHESRNLMVFLVCGSSNLFCAWNFLRSQLHAQWIGLEPNFVQANKIGAKAECLIFNQLIIKNNNIQNLKKIFLLVFSKNKPWCFINVSSFESFILLYFSLPPVCEHLSLSSLVVIFFILK